MSAEADYGENRSLDATDERILRLLEANGRASYNCRSRSGPNNRTQLHQSARTHAGNELELG
jgi:hypothetical protein